MKRISYGPTMFGATLLLLPALGFSQPVEPWKVKAKAGFAITQSSFTQNWSGDEVGTVSWISTAESEATKQIHPRANWHNTLVMAFGQTHQQDASRDRWLAPSKSADKIDYDGIIRLTVGQWVDPYAAVTLDTQFFQERAGLGSKALTPLRIAESVGAARVFFDQDSRRLVSRVGFAFRQNIDRLAPATGGGTTTETTNDGGLEWLTTARFATPKDQTVVKTEIKFYQALFFSKSDLDLEDDWKAIDITWQNTLSHKLNKWMALDLYVEFRYDKQIDKTGQLKQTLGVGMSWQLL